MSLFSAAESCMWQSSREDHWSARSEWREHEGAGMNSIRRNLDSVGYRLALPLQMREALATTRLFW
jgi:hypothetical protein